MNGLVIHGPTRLLLDFAQEDFGGPDQAAVIEDWRTRERHSRESQPRPGEFICHQHQHQQRPDLTLRQLPNGVLLAVHWPGLADACAVHRGMSDEHHRRVEYLQRAGQAAGYQVQTEVYLPTNVISDAVISGPAVQMGVEVQRSKLTAKAAKDRTAKAGRAGVLPVWFAMNSTVPPKWELAVPSVRSQRTDWTTLPHPRTLRVVSGVRQVRGRRCPSIRNNRCPQARRGCDRWHPDHEPLAVMVDDLAESFPAGDLVPLLHTTLDGKRQQVLIVQRRDKQRYEAITGQPADLPLTVHKQPPRQSDAEIVSTIDAGSKVAATPVLDPTAWQCDGCGLVRIIDMTGFRHTESECGGHFWPVDPWSTL